MADAQYFPISIDLKEIKVNKCYRRKVNDTLDLLVIKDSEQYLVFNEICPHMGGPLSDGRFCEKTGRIQCPWHGYWFDRDSGALAENPNDKIFSTIMNTWETHRPENRPNYRLIAYDYRISDNCLHVKRRSRTWNSLSPTKKNKIVP